MSEVSELGPTGAMPDETMRAELPALPEPARRQGAQMNYDGCDKVQFDCYDNSQMREYATAAILADRASRASAAPGGEPEWIALTDEDRDRAFQTLPDMLEGFMKKWGWLHFAKAIEAICREKNARPPSDAGQRGECEWAEESDEDMAGNWASACGQLWTFNDGGPVENEVKFCHGCGKPVKQRAAISESEGSRNG